MIYLLQSNLHWYEVGASIATMVGVLGVIFLIIEHFANRNLRNIQLMHRCIDNFRQWFNTYDQKVNISYLELLNEEFFYFQKRLIEKRVAIEWIEGILDFIQIYGKGDTILNTYLNQTSIETLGEWTNREVFFARIKYFIHPKLKVDIIIPAVNDPNHAEKKRELAKALYKHIKTYKY
jgi:hypothetical protein